MHRSRGSSGLNWKPHLIFWTVALAPPCSGVMPLLVFVGISAVSYAISVGTLSDVMPLPPGQLESRVSLDHEN